MTNENGVLHVQQKSELQEANAATGTTRALLANMIQGVTTGFYEEARAGRRGLPRAGPGQDAEPDSRLLAPGGYARSRKASRIETPTQTEVIIKGLDRQKVGQVAADIRGFRPPEPYKGKGVRYSDERVVLKEAKKK